ncbi:MAG: hypothetical protein AAF609_03485, partial [Cyanobacteria bacterium P01_C01_bin.120]
DSGFGVPCFEGGDRFLAQVETVGGGHRQESKLFIYFNRPDLYTDCYNLLHSCFIFGVSSAFQPRSLGRGSWQCSDDSGH